MILVKCLVSFTFIEIGWFATIPEDYTNTKEHQPNLKIFTAYTETFHWPEQDEQALSVKETIGENFHVLDCPNTKHQDLSDLNVHLPWIMTFMGLAGSEGGEKHVDQVINWFIENTNS